MSTYLIDMDNILVDILPTWLGKYNDLSGDNVKVEDIKTYDMNSICKDKDTLRKVLISPDFFFKLKPMPGAQEYFSKMLEEKNDMVIVTQLPVDSKTAATDKKRWMNKYFPKFNVHNMIFTHRKELVTGDVLFDDNEKHLRSWHEKNPNGHLATLIWPFTENLVNLDISFYGTIENGWKEFYHWTKEL